MADPVVTPLLKVFLERVLALFAMDRKSIDTHFIKIHQLVVFIGLSVAIVNAASWGPFSIDYSKLSFTLSLLESLFVFMAIALLDLRMLTFSEMQCRQHHLSPGFDLHGVFLVQDGDDLGKIVEKAEDAFKEWSSHWRFLLVMLLMLGVVRSLYYAGSFDVPITPESFGTLTRSGFAANMQCGLSILSNMASWIMVYLYLILLYPDLTWFDQSVWKNPKFYIAVIFIILMVADLLVISQMGQFFSVSSSTKNLLILIEGLASTVALCLWLGRMDSKNFQHKPYVLAFMYFYAAAQVPVAIIHTIPFWESLSASNAVAINYINSTLAFFSIVCFLGKAYLVFLVALSSSTYRLWMYFIRGVQLMNSTGNRNAKDFARAMAMPDPEQYRFAIVRIKGISSKAIHDYPGGAGKRDYDLGNEYLSIFDLRKANDHFSEAQRNGYGAASKQLELIDSFAYDEYSRSKIDLNSTGLYEFKRHANLDTDRAANLLAYRSALGGFTDIKQLGEIEGGLNAAQLNGCRSKFYVGKDSWHRYDLNSCSIQELDSLENHPYVCSLEHLVTPKLDLKNRVLARRGPGNRRDRITDINALSEVLTVDVEHLGKLAPYLNFD